jgi:hypothetical protein
MNRYEFGGADILVCHFSVVLEADKNVCPTKISK